MSKDAHRVCVVVGPETHLYLGADAFIVVNVASTSDADILNLWDPC